MTPRKTPSNRQPYPREENSLLAAHYLFPQHAPSLPDKTINQAIDVAFERTLRDRVGRLRPIAASPEALVKMCLKHLKERSDPILGPYFYSLGDAEDVFELDAIPHEMQRQRMNLGRFHQYLIIELMRAASSPHRDSNIEAVFDGTREGDVVADIQTPKLASGMRLYISVKKSSDTVGGQDVPGAVRRLENVAKSEKNITRPYLCVLCYATPPRGKIRSYQDSRSVRYDREGHAFSENCESWEPGFVYPYISGRLASDIYRLTLGKVGNHLPFYTLQYRKECTPLLQQKLKEAKLVDSNGKINRARFMEFVTMQGDKKQHG